MTKLGIAALLLLLGHAAQASSKPAVAVMPFKDLSGSKGAVGEAIRETVTTDLKGVSGLRVIERGQIDKILAEQNLQSHKSDLDALTTVKVGKLVGATLIVTGAYQQAAKQVRLTARFVRVETGEIVGTAKVDGAARDFLSLQDRITAQLVVSAGIGKQHARVFGRRPRPRLRSLRIMELYGQAVVEPDGKKKEKLLRAAVAEEPGFVYASRDLDQLEQRMRGYAAVAERAQAKAATELTRQIAQEKDPLKIYQFYVQLMANLMIQRRYRTLLEISREVIARPPPPPQMAGLLPLDEQAQAWIIRCHEQLKEDDALLREGERFLARYTTSMQFSVVRMLMDAAIERKRQREEGAVRATAEIAELGDKARDPCRTGPVYKSHNQLKQAKAALEACVKAGDDPHTPGLALFQLVFVEMDLGEFRASRRYLDRLRAVNPEMHRNARHLENMLPIEE